MPEAVPWLDVVGHLCRILWIGLCLCLAVYGFNALWMVLRAWWSRHRSRAGARAQVEAPRTWPCVTVQLPLYNELHVANRVIDACARLAYPREKLEIQVLDDSSDRTGHLAHARVAYWQHRGCNIHYCPRSARVGYKAGALQQGLAQATGEFLVLFDADFQPKRDFLLRLIPILLAPEQAGVGFVQARWRSRNTQQSWLTQAIDIAINGHFAVESQARSHAHLWFGFNGSAGIWRRSCLDDPRVGGWSSDSLCEDLDLSYRAQLAGWQGYYADHVTVPADLPIQLAAFRAQQFRWAKGSVQVLRKLGRAILQARHFTWGVRLQGLYHLSAYFIHLCVLGLLLLALPMALLEVAPPTWLRGLTPALLGPVLMAGYGSWRHPGLRWPALGALLVLGVGLCLSNSWAICEALQGKTSPFARTPKGDLDAQTSSAYLQDPWPLEDRMFPVEIFLIMYCLVAVSYGVYTGNSGVWPVSLLGLGGFGLLTVWAWWERYRAGWQLRSSLDETSQDDPGRA